MAGELGASSSRRLDDARCGVVRPAGCFGAVVAAGRCWYDRWARRWRGLIWASCGCCGDPGVALMGPRCRVPWPGMGRATPGPCARSPGWRCVLGPAERAPLAQVGRHRWYRPTSTPTWTLRAGRSVDGSPTRATVLDRGGATTRPAGVAAAAVTATVTVLRRPAPALRPVSHVSAERISPGRARRCPQRSCVDPSMSSVATDRSRVRRQPGGPGADQSLQRRHRHPRCTLECAGPVDPETSPRQPSTSPAVRPTPAPASAQEAPSCSLSQPPRRPDRDLLPALPPAFVRLPQHLRHRQHHGPSPRMSNALSSMNTKIRLLTRIAYGSSADALIALALLAHGGHRPTLPGRT